jgi:hypothetical protein
VKINKRTFMPFASIFVLLVFIPPQALAISQLDFNSLVTHSPHYKPGGSETNCGSASSVVLVGSDNAQKTYNYLTGKGLSPAQAAGLMGNIQAESGFEPRIVEISYPVGSSVYPEGRIFLNERGEQSWGGASSIEDDVPSDQYPSGQPGYGIVGFTFSGYKADLRKISQDTGVKAGDLGLQLDYLWGVITKSGLVDQIKQSTTVSDTVQLFESSFEHHYDDPQQARVNFGNAIMAQYGSGTVAPDATGTPTSTGGSGCNSGGSSSISGYANPLRDVPNVKPARIDEGVDYIGDGPVYAIGNAKVTYAAHDGVWPGGNFLSYTLSDGPAAGKSVFVAENCDVKVSAGQTVDNKTELCTMHSSSPYIETGWADPNAKDTAMAWSQYMTAAVPDGSATNFGQNFDALMVKLGAPAGAYQFPNQKGAQVGVPLPSDWPQW